MMFDVIIDRITPIENIENTDDDHDDDHDIIMILHNQVKNIAESFQNNILLMENINSIISTVNNLNPELDQISFVHDKNKIMILSNNTEVSGSKQGNEIVLTPTNFDLSIFNKDELIEILEYINSVVTDARFDYLQDIITREITK